MNEMTTVIATGFGIKILTAVVGAFAVWLFARAFDKIGGVKFSDMIENMDSNSYALYAGLRLLAIALFMGLVFSG